MQFQVYGQHDWSHLFTQPPDAEITVIAEECLSLSATCIKHLPAPTLQQILAGVFLDYVGMREPPTKFGIQPASSSALPPCNI